MAESRTRPGGGVAAYLAGVEPEARRVEAEALEALFRRATGWGPELWTGGMVGFGRYVYRYESGHGGEAFATGFAPRKAELSLYVLSGDAAQGALLARLGKHRAGKACLHVRRLSDVDMGALEELIRAGVRDHAARWPVTPT